MNTPPYITIATKARLNTPPFIEKSVTLSLVITNQSALYVHDLSIIDFKDEYSIKINYVLTENSAVLFFDEKKHIIKATESTNKITLEGIFVPPREKVFVFA